MADKVIGAADLFFHSSMSGDANRLILTYHYSKRLPSNIQFTGSFHLAGGLLGTGGEAVAAICFSIPPTRWNVEVWELSRLVRVDGYSIPLTRLISLSCKFIQKRNLMDLLVSFADAQHGHHGGVYQAAGWNYHGQRDAAMDGLLISGVFVPGRTCVSLYGTRSPDLLREKKPRWKIEPHYDIGKHLYWRALNRSGQEKADQLCLNSLRYLKPDLKPR